jgi:Domain of unknown function (DUF4189)
MRHVISTATFLLGLGWMLMLAAPALAEYGAIAWDEETGKYGASWNQDTPKRAAEKALSDCGATGCKVIIRPTTVCAALATAADGKAAGAAARKNRDDARLAALKGCQRRKAGECVIRVAECNK